jgi:GMP synthase-like glutamine amidotransferase
VRVVVVRHHAEDDPGFIAEAFAAHGAVLSMVHYPHDGPLPELGPGDHVVVLGAKWSVYDRDEVGAWIDDELSWLRAAERRGAGVLGICFGAQLLSAAFGGSVERAPVLEVGWTHVEPVAPAPGGPAPGTGRSPALAVAVAPGAVAPGPWLEFHGDRCVLPPSATVLARNDVCVQAFTLGRTLGVQFHPEVDADQLARWLDHGSRDAVDAAGLDPDELLARTRAEEPAARRRAAGLVDAYLAAFGG